MSSNSPEHYATAVSRRALALEYLHLFVLTTLAVTQPVYDRLSERGVFLANAGFGPAGLLLLTVILSLVIPALPPLALWCAGRFRPAFRSSLHMVLVFVLLTLIALPIVKRVEFWLTDWMVIGLSLAAAAAVTCGYFASRWMKMIATVMTPWVAVFPVLFLFGSPLKTFFFDPARVEFSQGQPIPVVMIVLDELCGTELVNTKGEVDALRYPHFAELARGSNWFRNATTVFPDTWQALPVILTGCYPTAKAAPRAAELPQNLFQMFESTGEFEMAVFEPVSHVAAPRLDVAPAVTQSALAQVLEVAPVVFHVYLHHLSPPDLRRSLPRISATWFGLSNSRPIDRYARRGVFRYQWGQNRRAQVEHFIDCLEEGQQPALYFCHVLLPHVPWCYLPSGRRYLAESAQWELLDFETHAAVANTWGTDELYVTHSQQRQLLQLQFTDALLGRILSKLRQTGLYDKCLLIVTADHGICFRVDELRRGVTDDNKADIMSVPLFVKTPGQETGAASDRNVESIDILPTIADVLKIKLPLPVDGRSVFDETAPERNGKTIYRNMEDPRESVAASVVKGGRSAQEIERRFGPANDPAALFRVGPHPELVGRRAGELRKGAGPVIEVELLRSGSRYTGDSEDIVPCYHEGLVVSPFNVDQPVQIAVAVNGVIGAVTRTYELDRIRNRWAAMIPEQMLRAGENDIRYYSVTGAGGDLRLTECKVVPARPKKPGVR